MREKELRLALICYGGISLAVYMHGITKEVWRLARAARRGAVPLDGTEAVFRRLLDEIDASGLRLHVLADIVAGASAGGINGVFLAHAIATGQSLEPLTTLWLESADIDALVDEGQRPLRGMSRLWASPIAWMAGRRRDGIDETVDPEVQAEVRAKLTSFVAQPWFSPPFGGKRFTNLLLDAFDAMAAAPSGPPLLPPGHPLDLFVTVTDFRGHPERLALNSPPEIVETEHRLTLAFTDDGRGAHDLGSAPALAFAARATASFPGAFPPFNVGELDAVLADRSTPWPDRDAFLTRALPRHAAIGQADKAVLIDGSVLANAPFRPAIDALKDRPAAREVDRRFVYIDPKPGVRSMRLTSEGELELPGFFQTVLGALSDIPREQPIRDNLEVIAARSARVDRLRGIVDALRPEVEATIEASFGSTWFLDSPTPARLAAWRAKAQGMAARQAGYAYAAYAHLKRVGILDEITGLLAALPGIAGTVEPATIRTGIAGALAALVGPIGAGDGEALILFYRNHDLAYRIRRLRFLARLLNTFDHAADTPREAIGAMRDAVYGSMALYFDRQRPDVYAADLADAVRAGDWSGALDRLAAARDLKHVDERADIAVAGALAGLPRPERRQLLLAYLGFTFYDAATLPLLQADGQDEFNPVKVDRISPDDCSAIRAGGAEATLKGIRFNSFGAFFSRAYRENDYLWGRLHGVERLIDIILSALPEGQRLPAGRAATLKRDAFRAILAEEASRLTAIPDLFRQLDAEIG